MAAVASGEEFVDPAAVRARVRSCITESGITQREFSERIGLDAPKLSRALSGNRRFTPDELVRIATVGGVTVNWLLSGSDQTSGVTNAPPADVLPARERGNPERAQKRQEIIAVAWRMFAERGFHAVRLAEIADECGTSASILNYYFSSKRELLEECLRYCVKLAFDRQTAEMSLDNAPADRLRHLLDLQLPAAVEVRQEWSIWLQSWSAVAVGAGSRLNHSRAYQRWYGTVREVLKEGQLAGVFTSAPVDDLAVELTGLFDGLGIKVLTGTLTPRAMRAHMRSFIDRTILIPNS